MSKKFQISVLLAFIGLSLLSFPAKSIVEDRDLNKKSYVIVRAWRPTETQVMPHYAVHALAAAAGGLVGHSSIEIVRKHHSTAVGYLEQTQLSLII